MFDVTAFDVEKFDSIIARGLCSGVGDPNDLCVTAIEMAAQPIAQEQASDGEAT